ncbi:MAG: DUF1566 domain-containing protein [Deltaproteobacteria bacterium]|nr:DUF1566 domain-containing protein [Deltaproteobacteria bacterium]
MKHFLFLFGTVAIVSFFDGGASGQSVRFVRDISKPNAPVVTDSVTGLVWQGCTLGQSGEDCSGTARTMPWLEALENCTHSTWANYDDWRLPNIAELRSIVDNGRSGLAIDTDYFPGTMSSFYWSSSSYVNLGGFGWSVQFSNGSVSSSGKDRFSYARCVRSGP